jgi:deferrochelatase/peroxidase EfeB
MGMPLVAPPSWGLAAPVAADAQGLVVSPFGHLPVAVALFLDAGKAQRGWLRALRRVAPVTAADGRQGERSAAIAFTATGLVRCGLAAEALPGSFERPFWEGMHHPQRRRRLGDADDSGTVVADGPRWSGNPEGADRTPLTVHALLALYTADEAGRDAWRREVEDELRAHGVSVACELPLSLRFDRQGVAREHFGFADGISQPIPYGEAVERRDAGPQPDPWHGVPLGDFVFGHANAYDEPSPGPLIEEKDGAGGISLFDLGRNGSYLVVRELHQDVAAFWESMEEAAAALGDPMKTGRWVAERVVGREMDGDLLLPGGKTLPPAPYEPHGPDNHFGFHGCDRNGFGCPIGSHVRRANPRDGLAPDEASTAGLLKAANNHRLLRRGRKFGDDYPESGEDDGKTRGLLFMALNTDITRQFEFVQQTWILNRAFANLQAETDPLCGPAGPFTVPDDPLRWRFGVKTFIRFAGGEYFFLPGLAALDWLEARA